MLINLNNISYFDYWCQYAIPAARTAYFMRVGAFGSPYGEGVVVQLVAPRAPRARRGQRRRPDGGEHEELQESIVKLQVPNHDISRKVGVYRM